MRSAFIVIGHNFQGSEIFQNSERNIQTYKKILYEKQRKNAVNGNCKINRVIIVTREPTNG